MIHLNTSNPWLSIKNKIAIFIMSFSGDEGCLFQCVRALEKLSPRYDFEIFVIDDGHNPIKNIPQNVNYSKSFFNRNGNLNGAECAHGMLMEMLRCARECGAEYVMKIDSDMVVRSLDRFLMPLSFNPEQVIGFKLNPLMNYAAGVSYIFPVKGLYEAIKKFGIWFKEEEEKEHFAAHCPEDWAISRCVSSVNGYQLYQFNQVDRPQYWLMAPFNFEEMKIGENGISIPRLTFVRFRMYDFVNFGNRYQLKCENPREIAADCMKEFNNFEEICQYEK